VDDTGKQRRWTENEIILGLYLYFQLPFGKLHSKNPEIIQLSQTIGRSSDAVAMKLCNFASLDPQITESGRKGLDKTSLLDRVLYKRFAEDWSGLVGFAETQWNDVMGLDHTPPATLHESRKVNLRGTPRWYSALGNHFSAARLSQTTTKPAA
jgi:hypothetical protein